MPVQTQARPTRMPSVGPTARPTAPTAQPSPAPTFFPLNRFSLPPTPTPPQPPLPPPLPVELRASTDRLTVYPGLTFRYTVQLQNVAPRDYICDPVCRYLYGNFGLDVFLPPSLRLMQAASLVYGKGADFFPTVSGEGNVSWPNAHIGNGQSMKYRMTLEVVQAAIEGAATITVAAHQNVLNSAGAIVGTCCFTVGPPLTVTVLTTMRRSPGSNARDIYKQRSSSMAGGAGTSVVVPVYANLGGKECDRCSVCLSAHASSMAEERRLGARRGSLCGLACKSCPAYVEANAGDRLTLQSPDIILNGNVTINGEMAIDVSSFVVDTGGPQTYDGRTLTFASSQGTVMIADSTWAALAGNTTFLGSKGGLELSAGALASLQSQTYTVAVQGQSAMESGNHTGITSGSMRYEAGTNLDWAVGDAATLQTGTFAVSATGTAAVSGRVRTLQGAGMGPPTDMQVSSEGFSVSTQGIVNMHCANFSMSATGSAAIVSDTLALLSSTGDTTITSVGRAHVRAHNVVIESPSGVVFTEAYNVTTVAGGPFALKSLAAQLQLEAAEGVAVATPASVEILAGNALNLTSSGQVVLSAGNAVLSVGETARVGAGESLELTSKKEASIDTRRFWAHTNESFVTSTGVWSLEASQLESTTSDLTSLTAQRMTLTSTDNTSSIPWSQMPNNIEGEIEFLTDLLLNKSFAELEKSLLDLEPTFKASALGISLAGGATLGLSARASASLSSDLSTSITGNKGVSIKAGAYPSISALAGSITLAVGPQYFIPFKTVKPQLQINPASMDLASEIITITGAAGMAGTLKIESFANLLGDLGVDGAAEFNGISTFKDDINVDAVATFKGETNVNGALTIEGDLTASGPVNIDSEEEVTVTSTGTIAFTTPDFDVNGDLLLEGELTVTGLSVFSDISTGDIKGLDIDVGDVSCGDLQGGALQVSHQTGLS